PGFKEPVAGDSKGVNLRVKNTDNKIDSNIIRKYIRDIEGRTGRELPKNQIEKLKDALRSREYNKLSPMETRKHRRAFNKVKDKLIEEWEINTG
ncbi:LXG family T7SS effector ribonuclease toxin YxiD, partial [Bacillus mobilis]